MHVASYFVNSYLYIVIVCRETATILNHAAATLTNWPRGQLTHVNNYPPLENCRERRVKVDLMALLEKLDNL